MRVRCGHCSIDHKYERQSLCSECDDSTGFSLAVQGEELQDQLTIYRYIRLVAAEMKVTNRRLKSLSNIRTLLVNTSEKLDRA